MNDPRLGVVASQYKKNPAQILIRWVMQHEVVVIPKSANKERIHENSNVFDFSLSREDMEALDSFHEDYRTSWDPTTIT